MLKPILGVLLTLGLTAAAAAQDACLIAGDIDLYGQKISIKDCMKLNGLSSGAVKKKCHETRDIASMGQKGLSVSFHGSCPAGYQGACLGISYDGIDMDAYYYKRDADSLPSLQQSCTLQGGTWK